VRSTRFRLFIICSFCRYWFH